MRRMGWVVLLVAVLGGPGFAGPQNDVVLNQAFRAYQAREYEKARELLEPLTEKQPELADAYRLLGHVYHALSREDDARDSFARALGLGGLTSDLLARLIEVELDAGEFPTALNALRVAALVEPQNRRIALMLAEHALELEAYREAEQIYRRLLKEDPTRPDLWLRRGELERRTGHLAESVRSYRITYALEPSASVAEILGDLSWQRGDAERAASWYLIAGLSDPSASPPARLQLRRAQALYVAGDLTGAEALVVLLQDATNLEVRDEAHRLLGQVAFESGRFAPAAAAWGKLAGRVLETPEIATFLVEYAVTTGDDLAALAHLQRRLKLAGPDRVSLTRLVALRLRTDNVVGAKEALRLYLEHFGWGSEAERMLREVSSPRP